MPFENFYEESDKADRRWWKIFGLAFLLFIGYWTFALLTMPDFEGDRKAAEYLKNTGRLRSVEALCTSLPMPEQFYLIEKDLPSNFADSTSIVYRYSSDRSPSEIMPFFVIWFNENGWKPIPNSGSMFRKDTQMVSIRVLQPFDIVSGYEIQCYESDY